MYAKNVLIRLMSLREVRDITAGMIGFSVASVLWAAGSVDITGIYDGLGRTCSELLHTCRCKEIKSRRVKSLLSL